VSDSAEYRDFLAEKIQKTYCITFGVTELVNLNDFEGTAVALLEDSSAIVRSDECGMKKMQRIDNGKPVAAAMTSAKVATQASQRLGFLRPSKHLVFAFRLIQNLWLMRCII
jgi:hypothetical protein